MANRAEQIEKGALRRMVSQKQKKILKKTKNKKIRKVKIDEVPADNRYNGWII
jgi:hypothetical protein